MSVSGCLRISLALLALLFLLERRLFALLFFHGTPRLFFAVGFLLGFAGEAFFLFPVL